jgi:hypothetical protein
MSARFSGRARSPLQWQASLGGLMAADARVYATCTGCGWTRNPLPLEPIAAKFGVNYSLWDRRPRCRQPGCTGRVLFMATLGDSTPYRPLKSV